MAGSHRQTVRIGNAGGYWGDDPRALERQILGPEPPEFITSDFLAEISMSILQKQRLRDPAAGYARDFVEQLAPRLGALRERGITVISNAGGVNPEGCAEALLEAANASGTPLTVAVVSGDDLAPRLDTLREAGVRLDHLETGEGLGNREGAVLSANAYLGAEPVVRALAHGPEVVVTGRVTDTGITLAALRSALGWEATDWDRIAQGLVAGHLIECGVQATGGNHTDWRRVPGLGRQGFPVVEAEADGAFTLTKQPGTGGLVSPAVAKEQLLYEIGDPALYLSPDATVDFRNLRAEADGPDRVRITGAKGGPPPDTLKVSLTLKEGFRVEAALFVGGPEVAAKARALEAALHERLSEDCAAAGIEPPEELRADLIGADGLQRRFAGEPATESTGEPTEGLVRFAARSDREEPLRRFRKLAPSLLLSGPAGLAVTGGAPRVSPVVRYWPALVPRREVTARVRVLRQRPGARREIVADEEVPARGPTRTAPAVSGGSDDRPTPSSPAVSPGAAPGDDRDEVEVALGAVAHARGGDKGDAVNLGVVARSRAGYRWLTDYLTAERMAAWAAGVAAGPVRRYRLPGLGALNFVLERALGGGGVESLLPDPQGKTLAPALLRRRVRIPRQILATIAEADRPTAPEFAPPGPGGRPAAPESAPAAPRSPDETESPAAPEPPAARRDSP